MCDEKACQIKAVKRQIARSKVVVYSKSKCPHCKAVKALFKDLGVEYVAIELDSLGSLGDSIQDALLELTGQSTVPNVFINGKHYGGNSQIQELKKSGALADILDGDSYDLIVVGGGTAGLSAAVTAADLGAKVALVDYVAESPKGTKWGLGGTCINVGCVPKILMHHAAISGQKLEDAGRVGFEVSIKDHSWPDLVSKISTHIKQLNQKTEASLEERNIAYFNARAKMKSRNEVQLVSMDANNDETLTVITGRKIILACGKRPRIPSDLVGSDLCITSDDLFSLPKHPGHVLCVGGGYVALETAGFLRSFGSRVTVAHTGDSSFLLPRFDRQMVDVVAENLRLSGIRFVSDGQLVKVESTTTDDDHHQLKAHVRNSSSEVRVLSVDTVLVAIGRKADVSDMDLHVAGVSVNADGEILVDESGRTGNPDIFAIGDVAAGTPDLASFATQCGKRVANFLFAENPDGRGLMRNFGDPPTVVFTPAEFASLGFSEEAAVAEFGADQVSAHFQYFAPVRERISVKYGGRNCAKVVCKKEKSGVEKVVGLHFVGPFAGEIMQGFVLAMETGLLTKQALDAMLGISGTNAQVLTNLQLSNKC
ncbi:unnamed protein product [Notodromas monacha]|uniref:Thioredoxin reductase n=1 Tax=Notodromas monacha TaxID=399045 RepID=A0A7R9BFW8_9CRUS|nr:unnamed protein product [Notodromas monacha]CAG0914711.1 unnamed protein product [Notodromas monacha]